MTRRRKKRKRFYDYPVEIRDAVIQAVGNVDALAIEDGTFDEDPEISRIVDCMPLGDLDLEEDVAWAAVESYYSQQEDYAEPEENPKKLKAKLLR